MLGTTKTTSEAHEQGQGNESPPGKAPSNVGEKSSLSTSTTLFGETVRNTFEGSLTDDLNRRTEPDESEEDEGPPLEPSSTGALEQKFMLPHGGLVTWDFNPKNPLGMKFRDVGDDQKEVTLDSKHVPHITGTVVDALNAVELGERAPGSMMTLPTGLPWRWLVDSRKGIAKEQWTRTRTKVAWLGLRGGVVLAYCAYNIAASGRVLNSVRTGIVTVLKRHGITYVEVGNDDPRHIGSHDASDTDESFAELPASHFHLVLSSPGLTDAAEKEIVALVDQQLA